MKNNNLKWIIGGVVILVAIIAMTSLNLGDNLLYFYTPVEVRAKAAELGDKTIKLGAMVKTGSVVWQPEKLSLEFIATDLKGNELKVLHSGTPPDMFKEGQGVVIEGRLTENGTTMISRHLLVKHSEEYKKPSEDGSTDRALLEKSLFKNENQAPRQN